MMAVLEPWDGQPTRCRAAKDLEKKPLWCHLAVLQPSTKSCGCPCPSWQKLKFAQNPKKYVRVQRHSVIQRGLLRREAQAPTLGSKPCDGFRIGAWPPAHVKHRTHSNYDSMSVRESWAQ